MAMTQQRISSIYDTLELASYSAYKYYTSGNRSVVIDPARGVQDGTWKTRDDLSEYVDFVITKKVNGFKNKMQDNFASIVIHRCLNL